MARPVVLATLLLIASNVFMTFAWYAHLRNLADRPWYIAALVSWGIALFEYLLQVPANRIGYTALSLPQLKILQEVITLSVFVPFAVFYMRQPLKLDYLWAALCIWAVFVPRPGSCSVSDTAIHRRVAAPAGGADPHLIARLASGWAVLGEQQFLRGYALLLPDPVVGTLNELHGAARAQVLADVAVLGDALLEVTGALRINYAIFGNLEPALHVHVVPRYGRGGRAAHAHPWSYDWNAAPRFDAAACAELAEGVQRELRRLGVTKPMRYTPGSNAVR